LLKQYIDTRLDVFLDFENIFAKKIGEKIAGYFAQTTASFFENIIIILFFDKTANFFAVNWRKSQKIVLINFDLAIWC
jgi:hypothetical protein